MASAGSPSEAGSWLADEVISILAKKKIPVVVVTPPPSVTPPPPTPTPSGPQPVTVVGYENHFFTSLAYTASSIAFVDLPASAQIVVVEPTTQAYVEFDNQPNPSPNGTPVIQALQGLVVPLQFKRIYVQGVSLSGTLYVWAYW